MRLLEFSLALVGLAVCAPALLAVAVAVKCTSSGPVFYKASRVGQGGRLFNLYKFRTMMDDGSRGPKVTGKNDPRVTRVGRILRRTNLDELPQLLNVLKGDMSFVGPRPEDPCYVDSYSAEQRRLLLVRPGITSLATVLHRHEEQMLTGSDWDRTYRDEILPAKLQIELDYLTNRTFSRDLAVVAQTVSALFSKPKHVEFNRGRGCQS